MTVLLTDRVGSQKTLTITMHTPSETLQGSPTTLPTSEPGTPQISYTVASGDLPTFSFLPYSNVWVACVYGAGKLATAGIISFRMKKNGASVGTSTVTCLINEYYTVSCWFYNVTVGDVLTLSLWSNQTDSNWDYNAYQIQPTRLIMTTKPRYLWPLNYSVVATHPTLTLGAPSVSTSSPYSYPTSSTTPFISIDAAMSLDIAYPATIYGLFRLGRGDISNGNGYVARHHATNHPYYYNNIVPTTIISRKLDVRGRA